MPSAFTKVRALFLQCRHVDRPPEIRICYQNELLGLYCQPVVATTARRLYSLFAQVRSNAKKKDWLRRGTGRAVLSAAYGQPTIEA